MKPFYQTDLRDYYTGPVDCLPDPHTPGNWWSPSGSYPDEPMPAGPRQIQKRVGGQSGHWILVPNWTGYEYWLADGTKHTITEPEVEPPIGHLSEPPPPTPAQFQRTVGIAVDQMLDELAQSWRYRSYISARAYANDPNPRFAAEAAALIAHGSQCWTVLDELEAAVIAGTAQMPTTVADVLALLPAPPERPGV